LCCWFKKIVPLLLALRLFPLDLARVKGRIETLGALKFKEFPRVVYLGREDIKKLVLRELNFKEEEFLLPLGIIKDRNSYRKRKISLFAGGGVGFFSPSYPRRVFVARDWPEFYQELALVHELRHYLQWEHFPTLFARLQQGFLGEDTATALLAVLEGDATWLTERYFSREDLQIFPEILSGNFLTGIVSFVYRRGYDSVERAWKGRGLKGVLGLLKNPPRHTAWFFGRKYREIPCICRGEKVSLGMETYSFLLGQWALHLEGDCLCREGNDLKGILEFDSPHSSALAMKFISYKIKRRISEKIIFQVEVKNDSRNPGKEGNDP